MNIAIARKNAGLTQQQLADRIGVTRAAVANWEVGIGQPRLIHALSLRTVLGLTLDQIYGTDDTKAEAA